MINIKKLDLPEVTPTLVREEYIYYESQSSTYRNEMASDQQFYLGNQLTMAQKEFLVSVGQPPEPNNKIKPAVEQVLANVASSPPAWSAEPIEKTDSDFAYIATLLLESIWDASKGNMAFRQQVKDYIVKGIAYTFTYPDWNAEGGLGAVRMRRLPPESVFVDSNSAEPDFSDAFSIIYSDLHV